MASKFRGATALTGGGTGSVDAVDGNDLSDGDKTLALTTEYLYPYNLDDDSAAAESSPDVIAPDSNPGDMRHILIGIYAAALRLATGGAVNEIVTSIDTGSPLDTALATEQAIVEYGASLGSGLPKGYIDGLIFNLDSGDTDHDIEIAVGECRDYADSTDMSISAVLTKQIDANWSAGDDAGGFPSGLTLSADTIYYVFLIMNTSTSTVDAGFDTSATAANLLSDASGYTKYRWLGWVLTDGSNNILSFKMIGDGRNLEYSQTARLSVASSLSSTSYTTQALSAHIPTATGNINTVKFGAIAAGGDAYVMLSDDGTNMKTAIYADSSSNTIGSQNELHNIGGSGDDYIPIDGDNVHYKVHANSVELFIRSTRFKR